VQNIEFRSITQPLELWEIFFDECSGHITVFRDLATDQDKIQSVEGERKLSHRLHRLKGSLGFIGFTVFSEKIKQCENLVNEKKISPFPTLIEITNELEELHSELKKLIHK